MPMYFLDLRKFVKSKEMFLSVLLPTTI